MAKVAQSVDGGENVDDENIMEWLKCDDNLSTFEELLPSEIVEKITIPRVEAIQTPLPTPASKNKMSHGEALFHVEKLLVYYECDEEASFTDLMYLKNIRSNIRIKEMSSQKQKSIKDFFS